MAYMLLIVEPVEQRRERSAAEGRAVYEQMLGYGRALQQEGVLLAGESLVSHAEATRVAVRGARVQTLDGPFAETKEMIGGFFMVDCRTREEAVALAARCPAAAWATVEVRTLGPCTR